MPLLLCPNDNSSMQTVDRDGVQFDMCPTCRGVWLDRGELEKLMSAAQDNAPPPAAPQRPVAPPPPHPAHGGYRGYGEAGEYGERGEYGHRRKRSSIFDIFD